MLDMRIFSVGGDESGCREAEQEDFEECQIMEEVWEERGGDERVSSPLVSMEVEGNGLEERRQDEAEVRDGEVKGGTFDRCVLGEHGEYV